MVTRARPSVYLAMARGYADFSRTIACGIQAVSNGYGPGTSTAGVAAGGTDAAHGPIPAGAPPATHGATGPGGWSTSACSSRDQARSSWASLPWAQSSGVSSTTTSGSVP